MKNYTYFQLWEIPKGCSTYDVEYCASYDKIENLYTHVDQLKKNGSGWIITKTDVEYEAPVS
jgi:hypothetical protein